MSVPKLRFKEFERKWDLKSLGDCFNLFSGFAFPSSASVDNGIKWLKIADVGIQEMTPNNLSFLPNDFKAKFPQFIVSKNDYVIALTRPILNKKLKIAKVGEFYDGALLNQRVAKIVSDNNNLDFIYSLLQKSKTVEELENSIAGTDPPNLSLNEVKGIVLGIPKVEEQTKIASFLSSVDEKISQLIQKHALLSQYKQGMMQKLFSRQIRFKADDGSEFGEWEETLLSEFLTESLIKGLKGNEAKKLTVKLWGKGVVPKNEVFEGSENTQYYKRFVGQLIYGKLDFLNCAFGIIPSHLDGYETTIDAPSFDINKEKANAYFLLNRFLQKDFYKKNGEEADGSRKAKRINQNVFLAMQIDLPCLEEQTKIANFLSNIDQKIAVVAQQVEQAKQWKKRLVAADVCLIFSYQQSKETYFAFSHFIKLKIGSIMKKLILVAFMALPMLAQAQTFKYQKDISGFKHYKGNLTLTGTYSRTLDPEYLEYMGDGICFEPNKTSSAFIPRLKDDERTAWFCFSNFEQAKKTFKLPDTIKKDYCKYEGKATITIKDYNLFVVETEGSDLTQLVSAKNITPAKAVKCEVQY